MARLGKPLAVAAFVLCVLFLGFTAAARLGGENWEARAAADEVSEFGITTIGGGDQPVRYQVVDRVTNETVQTKDSMAAAVVAAYQEKARRLQTERTELQGRIAALKADEPVVKARNQADLAAMDARLDAQRAELKRLAEELVAATAQGADLTRQAERIRAEAALRADDAARQRVDLDAVRTDAARVREQIAALKDRLVRLEGARARAERRRAQLAARLE